MGGKRNWTREPSGAWRCEASEGPERQRRRKIGSPRGKRFAEGGVSLCKWNTWRESVYPDEGWDVNVLEEACWKAGREASKGLFILGLEKRDEEVVAGAEGKKKGKVTRYLVSRFGVVTFYRKKVMQSGFLATIGGSTG